jgi:hypothetical protein
MFPSVFSSRALAALILPRPRDLLLAGAGLDGLDDVEHHQLY